MTNSTAGATAKYRKMYGMAKTYRAEQRKLLAQLSTRVLIIVCILGPFAFGVILTQQSSVPADTLFGVWVHSSGYAVSLVVLSFGGYLAFPVLGGVLAGDLFSSEDRYGTWKTVLTRSRTRRDLFWGKIIAAVAFSVVLMSLVALSSILAGLLLTGDQPLVGLGGNVLSSGEALSLVLMSWLLSIPPLLAFMSLAILFSVATRNGIVGVLGPVLFGLVMQLLELIGSGSWVHALLVSSAFNDWHGLLSSPKFYGPLVTGSCVSMLWIAICLGMSWLILRRRDFAGTPVARRLGWMLSVRVVLSCAVVVVVFGAATSLGPVAITQARLETSISFVFNRLTVLQQKELGRNIPQGAKLKLRTVCARHAGQSQGPGDDWTCTLTVITATPGSEPFLATPVTYDLSAKADGCYKADAPPSFVGQQTMSVPGGGSAVNPLYTIYACFTTSGKTPGCMKGSICGQNTSPVSPAHSKSKASTATRQAEQRNALKKAEEEAGPSVVQEVSEAERREKQAAENPGGEAVPEVGG